MPERLASKLASRCISISGQLGACAFWQLDRGPHVTSPKLAGGLFRSGQRGADRYRQSSRPYSAGRARRPPRSCRRTPSKSSSSLAPYVRQKRRPRAGRPRLGAGPLPPHVALLAAMRSMRSAISLLFIDPPHTPENSAKIPLWKDRRTVAHHRHCRRSGQHRAGRYLLLRARMPNQDARDISNPYFTRHIARRTSRSTRNRRSIDAHLPSRMRQTAENDANETQCGHAARKDGARIGSCRSKELRAFVERQTGRRALLGSRPVPAFCPRSQSNSEAGHASGCLSLWFWWARRVVGKFRVGPLGSNS